MDDHKPKAKENGLLLQGKGYYIMECNLKLWKHQYLKQQTQLLA